jgi:flagellar hook-length control protein FliK
LRHAQAISERTEALKDRPLAQASHDVQRATRGVRTRGHPSLAPIDSAQGRPASNGAIVTSEGERASHRQAAFDVVTQPEPVVAGTDRPVILSQLASHHASTAGDLEGTVAKGLTQSISEQIRDSMHASLARGDRQFVIRLHPPELGSVLVRLGEQNEQIHGVLEVSRAETRHEIEQALPEVLRSLQDLGLQVRRVEVTVSDDAGKDMGGQQLQQDGRPQQDSDRYPHPSNSEFPNSNFEAGKAGITTTIDVPTGRIDMLI